MTPARARIVAVTLIFAAGLIVGSSAAGHHRVSIRPLADPEWHHQVAAHIENEQCLVDGYANKTPFTFIVDSGAAFPLFFTTDHARALGYDPARLAYDHTYQNWIGAVQGATVRLREFRLGDFVLNDVEAAIDQSGFRRPLLGMAILKRLHLRIDTDTCVLSW